MKRLLIIAGILGLFALPTQAAAPAASLDPYVLGITEDGRLVWAGPHGLRVDFLTTAIIPDPPPTTINAASCSRTDVGTAEAAAVDGDTVVIPACPQENWTTQLTTTKCIIIKGTDEGGTPWAPTQTLDGNNRPQAAAWSASHTIIGDNVTKNGGSSSSLISMACSLSVNEWGLNTLEVVGVAADTDNWNKGHLTFSGTSTTFRTHHIKFTTMQTSGIKGSGGCLNGDIDHIEFGAQGRQGVLWEAHSSCNGGGSGDGPWATATALGNSTAIVVEDSVALGQGQGLGIIDAFQGARTVVRNSTFCYAASHGTESGNRRRGLRQFEFYDNVVVNCVLNGNNSEGFYIRSGTGVIYNNAFKTSGSGSFSNLGRFDNDRSKDRFRPWGGRAPTSITRSGSVATVTLVAHGLNTSDVVNVSGADQAEYNVTNKTITKIDNDSFTYTVSGTPATPATGTILVAGIPGACDGASPYDTNDGTIYVTGSFDGTDGVSNVLTDSTKDFTTACAGGNCGTGGYSVRNTTKQWGSQVASATTTTVTNTGSVFGQGRVWNTGDTYQILKAYPCLDQVGRGAGATLSGTVPVPAAAVNQASDPVYVWGNTLNGSPSTAFGSSSKHIVSGRDWINETKAGYTKLAYPFCVNGIGPGCTGKPVVPWSGAPRAARQDAGREDLPVARVAPTIFLEEHK